MRQGGPTLGAQRGMHRGVKAGKRRAEGRWLGCWSMRHRHSDAPKMDRGVIDVDMDMYSYYGVNRQGCRLVAMWVDGWRMVGGDWGLCGRRRVAGHIGTLGKILRGDQCAVPPLRALG